MPTVPIQQPTNYIQTKPSNRGRLILLVGPPGSGKTTFAAQFPNTYWIVDPKETGVLDLMESRQIRVDPNYIHPFIKDFPQLQYLVSQIITVKGTIPQNVQTIVFESVSGFEAAAKNHCCMIDYKNDWSEKGFMSFQNGYKQTANGYWLPFITQLQQLRELGYNVILTGHSTTTKEKNKSGVDYLIETCSCEKRTWDVTHPFFENVFFLSYRVDAEKENRTAQGKAKGYTKMLYVNQTPYQNAKNRCGLAEDLEADCSPQQLYLNLCNAARWNPQTLRYI